MIGTVNQLALQYLQYITPISHHLKGATAWNNIMCNFMCDMVFLNSASYQKTSFLWWTRHDTGTEARNNQILMIILHCLRNICKDDGFAHHCCHLTKNMSIWQEIGHIWSTCCLTLVIFTLTCVSYRVKEKSEYTQFLYNFFNSAFCNFWSLAVKDTTVLKKRNFTILKGHS